MKRRGTPLKAPPAKRALTLAQTQEVQRQVNRTIARQKDYKVCILEEAAQSIDFSGTVFDLLSPMARGDNGRNNFEGQHIQVQNIHVRGAIAVADNTNYVRVVIFQWMDDTAPVTTSILDNAGIIGTVDAPFATRNWTNRPLFKILRDDLFDMQSTNITAGGPNGNVKVLDYFIKSKKISKTFYAATIVAVQKGGIFMCVVTDSGAVAHPQLKFTSEIVFTD